MVQYREVQLTLYPVTRLERTMRTALRAAIVLAFLAQAMHAAPVSSNDAAAAAATFAALRYPAPAGAGGRLAIASVSPLVEGSVTIGHVAALSPEGYVLLRADDCCPPVKLYSDHGSFARLSPCMREVLVFELGGELAELNAQTVRGRVVGTANAAQWAALKGSKAAAPELALYAEAGESKAGPILATTWNQDSPYNLYAPPAANGPGGRAYAGCVACAMSQILRFHQSPVAVSNDYVYTDGYGSCHGTHRLSEAGLGMYAWADMPLSITDSSPLAQRDAVAQLMYHCGVTVDMDYEADGSGAYSVLVPGALRSYFGCSCGELLSKDGIYSDTEWYDLADGSIASNRPVYYAMTGPRGGHAVVCDGTRNRNEFHINMGWSGADDAWYLMNNIDGFNTNHRMIPQIIPGPAGSGTGELATTALKATLVWTDKIMPGGTLPAGAGSISYAGSMPAPVATLSFLSGVNLDWTLRLSASTTNLYFGSNTFIKIDKKATKASFGFTDTTMKQKWLFVVWLKKGRMYVKAAGKNLAGLSTGFDIGPGGTRFTMGKTVDLELNVTAGNRTIHALGTRQISFSTKANVKTTIK